MNDEKTVVSSSNNTFVISSISGISLTRLLSIDIFSALVSACSLAPFVFMVDQAVTQHASKAATLVGSMRQSTRTLLRSPTVFLSSRGYIAVAVVYSGTYIMANCTTTLCERKARDATLPKLFAASGSNMTLGITKDALFAKWFGSLTASKPPPVPPAVMMVFGARDLLTMSAGFVLPDIVSRRLVEHGVVDDQQTSDTVTQITVPMAAQAFLTPIHLLGLDLYNRPGPHIQLSERVRFVSVIFKESVGMRMMRFGAIYGFGGVLNKHIKERLRCFIDDVDE